MYKTGTNGKRNFQSLCGLPSGHSMHCSPSNWYERKWLPSKTWQLFCVLDFHHYRFLFLHNRVSKTNMRQTQPVGIQFLSGIPNLRKGAASVRESQLAVSKWGNSEASPCKIHTQPAKINCQRQSEAWYSTELHCGFCANGCGFIPTDYNCCRTIMWSDISFVQVCKL